MRIAPIKARLLDQVPSFATIAGAAGMAAAMTNGQFGYSAYVFQSSKTARDNQLVNAVSQVLPHEITVAYWVQDVSDATGEALMDTLSDLSDEVCAALVGWTPDGLKSPLFYKRGAIVDFRFGRAIWADIFSIDTLLRSA